MATERTRVMVLGGLVVVLLAVAYRALLTTSSAPVPVPKSKAAAPPAARTAAGAPSVPDVHLEALNEERPKQAPAERNLFRFKPKPPPPEPPRPAQAVAPRPIPVAPVGPPPPPPIPLKFIGIIDAPQPARRLAAFVDATGHPYHGAEGDVVAGQYRILKIGVESIEMAYLDGRGRQTIRLSGS